MAGLRAGPVFALSVGLALAGSAAALPFPPLPVHVCEVDGFVPSYCFFACKPGVAYVLTAVGVPANGTIACPGEGAKTCRGTPTCTTTVMGRGGFGYCIASGPSLVLCTWT